MPLHLKHNIQSAYKGSEQSNWPKIKLLSAFQLIHVRFILSKSAVSYFEHSETNIPLQMNGYFLVRPFRSIWCDCSMLIYIKHVQPLLFVLYTMYSRDNLHTLVLKFLIFLVNTVVYKCSMYLTDLRTNLRNICDQYVI